MNSPGPRAGRVLTITYIGLPLAGKTTSIKHAATSRDGSLLLFADLGFEGVAARKLQLLLPLDAGEWALLQTLSGAVWSPTAWKFLLANTDAVVYVVDGQEARAAEQKEFDGFVLRAIGVSLFRISDCPLVIQINKQDLMSERRISELAVRYRKLAPAAFTSLAPAGLGSVEVLETAISAVRKRNAARPHKMDGQVSLELRRWDPFETRE